MPPKVQDVDALAEATWAPMERALNEVNAVIRGERRSLSSDGLPDSLWWYGYIHDAVCNYHAIAFVASANES